MKETAKELSADGRVNWVRKLVLVCKMAHKYVENGLAEFIYIKRILQISSTHNTHTQTPTHTDCDLCLCHYYKRLSDPFFTFIYFLFLCLWLFVALVTADARLGGGRGRKWSIVIESRRICYTHGHKSVADANFVRRHTRFKCCSPHTVHTFARFSRQKFI